MASHKMSMGVVVEPELDFLRTLIVAVCRGKRDGLGQRGQCDYSLAKIWSNFGLSRLILANVSDFSLGPLISRSRPLRAILR